MSKDAQYRRIVHVRFGFESIWVWMHTNVPRVHPQQKIHPQFVEARVISRARTYTVVRNEATQTVEVYAIFSAVECVLS